MEKQVVSNRQAQSLLVLISIVALTLVTRMEVVAQERGSFKVGDRVLASVLGLKDEKYYQPCTVIGGLKDNAYGLKCDPHNGQPVMEYSVRPEWIKIRANATPGSNG